MKKNVKRILSFVLMAVMVFALLPVFGKPIVVKADDVQEHDHSNWTKISTSDQLMELGLTGGSGYLTNDIEISEPFSIHPNKTVNLCLNGKSIIQTADEYTIAVYGTLNLYDESKEPGKITHNKAKGRGVYNEGTFTMNGGTISGNNATYGGGVYNTETFTMNGGTISGNNATYGGGVYNSETFTMEGGTISGNNANYGGGVNNYYGIFTMNGGTISGNNATYYGGGVRNFNGTFTMTEGTISGNNATYGGGVLNGENGTFTMEGGTISENKAISDGNNDSHGGGVYNSGTFTMEGGTISENKAISDENTDSHGGGVENDGTFTMTEGTISGNNADYGGGVDNDGIFTMTEGTISGNEATYGGGVYNINEFTMEGGKISGNKAKNGGGVYTVREFKMKEGKISENEIEYDSNINTGMIGVGVYNHFELIMYGGTISGNGNENYVGFYNDGDAMLNGGYFLDSTNGFDTRTVTITFDSNDGSNKTITQYVPENKEIFLAPNQFTYDHKRFEGWNTDRNGNGKPYKDNDKINIRNNLILYAQWKDVDIISYDVNFVVNNGSWFDGTNDKKTVTIWRYEDEDKTLILKDTDIPSLGNPNTGYKTGKWETDPDTDHTVTSNITYTYNFEPIWYTIKFDANGGEGTMLDQSRTYNDKEPLTPNAFTFEGKTFDGWSTFPDGSGTHYADKEKGNLSSTKYDVITLYANWTDNTYTISWKDYDGTVLETDTDVAYGSTPTFDGETPKRDNAGNIKYTFAGWTPEIDTVKGAATYTATYSEEEIVEPTEPTTPEEPTNPTTPEEPTEPEVPEITESEPEPDIPEKDWLDDLRLALRIADELGGPQTVEYSGDFALSYDIMEYLKEHTDITLVYNVTYEGFTYTITIPAGRAIADANIGWYGPLWLLANYGGENVPDIIAGSGRYTVVEGDTLSGIAEKFNTTVEELAKKNGIKNPDYIIVGQVIVY